MPEGILTALETAERDSSVRAIVMICAGRTFISGADIKELEAGRPQPAFGRSGSASAADPDRGLRQARDHGDPRHGFRRRPGDRHGGTLSRGGRGRVAGRARGESRHHSGSRGNAASAAPGGRRRGGGDVRLGKTDQGSASVADGLDRPGDRRRPAVRRGRVRGRSRRSAGSQNPREKRQAGDGVRERSDLRSRPGPGGARSGAIRPRRWRRSKRWKPRRRFRSTKAARRSARSFDGFWRATRPRR